MTQETTQTTLQQERDALHREAMAYEDNPANIKDRKAWHETVQRYADRIKVLDYQIKIANA